MTEQYTPTTEQVRLEYMAVRWGKNDTVSFEARAEFDRWLAEHDRQVAEKVWWETALFIAVGERHMDIAHVYQKQNPYMEASSE